MRQALVRLKHKVHSDGRRVLTHAALLERKEEAFLVLPERNGPKQLLLRHVTAATAIGAIADADYLAADGWRAEGDKVDGRRVAIVVIDGVDDRRSSKKGKIGRKLHANHSVVDKAMDVEAHVKADGARGAVGCAIVPRATRQAKTLGVSTQIDSTLDRGRAHYK